MRHLKKYDKTNDLQIGDYVICKDESPSIKLQKFISSNIGQYVSDDPSEYSFDIIYPYVIEYKNIPKELLDNIDFINNKRAMRKNEIIYWSKNPKDLEIYININKYNL